MKKSVLVLGCVALATVNAGGKYWILLSSKLRF
jgi:hypothetical protein